MVVIAILAIAIPAQTPMCKRRTTLSYCSIRHGPDGQGIPLQLAPVIQSSEKYIVEQLKKYKAGVRGATRRMSLVKNAPHVPNIVDRRGRAGRRQPHCIFGIVAD